MVGQTNCFPVWGASFSTWQVRLLLVSGRGAINGKIYYFGTGHLHVGALIFFYLWSTERSSFGWDLRCKRVTGPNQCMARGRAHGYVISYYMLAWLRLVSSPKSLEKSPRIPEKCLSSLLFHACFYTVDGQNLSLIDMNLIHEFQCLDQSQLVLASC